MARNKTQTTKSKAPKKEAKESAASQEANNNSMKNPKKRKHEQRDDAAQIDQEQQAMLEKVQKAAKRIPAFMQAREKEAAIKRQPPAMLRSTEATNAAAT